MSTALGLALGHIFYISAVNDEVSQWKRPDNATDDQVFSYQYIGYDHAAVLVPVWMGVLRCRLLVHLAHGIIPHSHCILSLLSFYMHLHIVQVFYLVS